MAADRQRTLIVVPTFNEAHNVAHLLNRVRRAVPDADVLVVDGASPDGTAAVAGKVADELGGITVVHQPKKSGLGSAYREGFAHGLARDYDVIVEMDADLSHDPTDLPRLLRELAEGVDLVVGSRYVPGGDIPEWPWHRRLISRIGNRYAARVLGLHLGDATAGFRVYAAETLRSIRPERTRANGYAFQVEMAYRVAKRGGRIVEVPITFGDRRRGSSKMSGLIVVEAMVLVTLWGIRDRLLRRPHPNEPESEPAAATGTARR
ncbi:MAG: polyprenol monophosphomannose synthase [Acidimicrobiales bacterium]